MLTSATAAQPLELPGTLDPPSPSDADPSDSELDDLLNLNPEQLSRVNVVETTTLTDPIVESVSKAPEKVSEAPGIVDVITAQDIREFGAKNLYEVLERATSVYMTGSFMQRRNVASIRGNLTKHEDNQVLLLIDGRPFRDSTFGGINQALYTAFPLQAIERIEVIRGPGSVLYGTNALTGVINIVTKRPDGPTSHVSTLAGSYGWQSYGLAAGQGDGSNGLYVGATYSRADGWPFTATLEDSITDTVAYGEENIGVFASYRRGGFTAEVFAAGAQQMSVGGVPTWPAFESDDPRVFVDLGYRHEIDDCQRLQLNFTYNYDGFNVDTIFPLATEPVNLFVNSHGYLAEATYTAALTERLDFMLGGLADTHQGSTAFNSIPPFTETWYGVYTQVEYRPADWLKLVGGMQGNMPGGVKGGIVPRAGVIAALTDRLTGKFLYGQAFRSPYQLERSIVSLPIVQGNPALQPETIQTFDIQLAYQTEDFRLAATAFHSEFFGVVTRVNASPQTYVNEGRIQYQGFELENDWRISDRWRWLGSTTYQENTRGGVDNTTSVPNWMAKLGLAYTNKCSGLTVGLFDTFYGAPTVPATAANVNPEPTAYHLVSLNTTLDIGQLRGWRDSRSLRGQFLIQNLLDEDIHHVEFERELINSLPAGPGITFYGGVTYEF